MATRRNNTWWRGKRRKISARAIPKTIARVRKHRIMTYNTMQQCEFTCVPFATDSCVKNESIILMRNADLQTLFGDTVKIVSIRGSVYFRPLVNLPWDETNECVTGNFGDPGRWLAFMNTQRNTILQMRVAMLKTLTTVNAPFGFEVPEYFLDESFDWSEGSFMKRWEHFWFPQETMGIDHMMQNSHLGVCSVVAKAATVVPPTVTGSNPGWIDSAIATACTGIGEVTADGRPQRAYRQMRPWAPWRVNVNTRRVINLEENENLEMPFALGTLFPGADCTQPTDDCQQECVAAPCSLQVIPNLLMTLQYG